MTLNFQIRREDVLAFSREYYIASPIYQKARLKVRWMLPVLMICMWLYSYITDGFKWTATIIYLGAAIAWFLYYLRQFDRQVGQYIEQVVDETTYRKCLGPCELTLSESGLHSKSNLGESQFYWGAVERVLLNDTYCFIFLTGSTGYSIPINDVGQDAAKAAYEFVQSHLNQG